jgi:hypothetical protein
MKKTILSALVIVLSLVTGMAKADFVFGEPTNLGPLVNSSSTEFTGSISQDGLSFYFASTRSPGGFQDFNIWVSTRQKTTEEWGEPEYLGDVVNSKQNEWTPFLSPNSLELYMAKGPWGNTDLSVSRRNNLKDPWGPPESLGPNVNGSGWDGTPSITEDGLELYFDSVRSGGFGGPDLYVSKRASIHDPWGAPKNLGQVVNSSYGTSNYSDQGPSITPDGLTLFFGSARPPGSTSNMNIWMTRRASREDEWEPPVLLDSNVNSSHGDMAPSISADGRMLYFTSDRPGGYGGSADFWQVSIDPVVDLNSDGIVNSADMTVIIDHWGTDNSLCDIGPMPWGDGIVDVRDLIVLAEHLFEVHRLIHHWNLDETGGSTAYDSVGYKDAVLHGGPLWQPTAGMIDGALSLDGVDDYLTTPFILDPAVGSFGVFSWIKGTEPGRAIISQNDSSGFSQLWLGADPAHGKLMTRLMHPPFVPLLSEAVITDDQWHHVGLVFDIDKLHRYLFVDGVNVAEDTDYAAGVTLDGGLFIGVGEGINLATCWSGLIDDVRIYDNALSEEAVAALAQ